MTLKEIIKEKTNLLENAEVLLYEGIEAAEKGIFSAVLKILRGLAVEDGKLKKENINNSLLKRLKSKVVEAIVGSTLKNKIGDFLPNFEKIEELNDALYTDLADKKFTKKVRSEIGVFRKLMTDNIVDSVLGEPSIEVNFGEDIRRILFNGISTRQKVTDIEDQLRRYIKGGSNSQGKFSRYVKQIAQDALNQHDGYINDLSRDVYNLDGWMYVGSIIDTSRANCKHLVNSTGKLAPFAIRKGVYRVEDIEAIIKVLDKGKGSGFNTAVTKETWAQYRGGYNCRHQNLYITLSAKDKQREILQA